MLLVDAGNTFIKWARPNPDQIFNPESVSWKNFGAVRHHELATLKSAWKKLHEEKPIPAHPHFQCRRPISWQHSF